MSALHWNCFSNPKQDYDWVRVVDTNPNNSWVSPWLLENKNSINQPSVVFGNALKGDVLVVQLLDLELQFTVRSDYLFATDPAFSVDGKNHAIVNTNGGATVSLRNPTQTWAIWLEDLSDRWKSDWDFNDQVIALSNITVSFADSPAPDSNAPVPELASMSLLGSAISTAWLLRKKLA